LKNWSNDLAGDDLTCTILLFAAAADATGKREMKITLPASSTVGDAFDAVANEHESLAAMKEYCAIAVDQQISKRSTPLHDGCTVAILPPVSGG
jgi:molybdopterin converting factor subunit 1